MKLIKITSFEGELHLADLMALLPLVLSFQRRDAHLVLALLHHPSHLLQAASQLVVGYLEHLLVFPELCLLLERILAYTQCCYCKKAGLVFTRDVERIAQLN